jgi:hypothetical protein
MFVAAGVLSGCASTKGFSGRETIYGIVMNGNHKAVSGYLLELDSGKATLSSETGMFAFENTRAGPTGLSGSKLGYLPLKQSIDIIDKRQILYVTVTSVGEIFDRCDALFETETWNQAEALLRDMLTQTAQEQEIPAELLQFYLATALYKQKKYEETANILAGLFDLKKQTSVKTGIEVTASMFYFKLMQEMEAENDES